MAPPDRFRARKQPKQQRSAETRDRILDAAAHVFAEFGYRGGTTNRIAEAANISIGSLYQYFPNKDAILAALTDAHIDAGAALLATRLAAGMPPALEDQLRLFVRATIDNHRDDPQLHQVLFAEAPRSPTLLARLRDAEEIAVAAAHDLLARHPDVQVPDLKFAARMTVATIESLTHRLIACAQPADAQELEDSMTDMLAAYLRGQRFSSARPRGLVAPPQRQPAAPSGRPASRR